MLTNLLPTLRSVRAALVAGSVWLVAIAIAIARWSPGRHSGLSQVWRSVRAFAELAPDVVPLAGALLAAYLLGVASEAAFGWVTRWFTVLIVQIHRALPGVHEPHSPVLKRKTTTLDGFLYSAAGSAYDVFGEDPTPEVRRASLRVRLSEPQLERDVDRHRAEAEFRLQLLVPVLALASAVALHVGLVAAALLVATAFVSIVVIAASANHAAERANELLADWYRLTRDDDSQAINAAGGPSGVG
jgi:hypothetical protein